MVKQQVSKEQIDRAKLHREELPNNPRNSIRNGGGSHWGCLGEIVAADFYGVPDNQATRDYDIILPAYNAEGILLGKVKVDVKTKDRNVPVDFSRFDATVSDYNTQQQCHLYLFASTQKPDWRSSFEQTHSCYLIGFVRKDQLLCDRNFRAKGSIDPTASRRQIESGTGVYRCDCYSIPYASLTIPVREDAKLVLSQADVDYFLASGMPLLPPDPA